MYYFSCLTFNNKVVVSLLDNCVSKDSPRVNNGDFTDKALQPAICFPGLKPVKAFLVSLRLPDWVSSYRHFTFSQGQSRFSVHNNFPYKPLL